MESRITDQPAFLLHRRPFQESSLILDIFTRDYGRLSLIAKGARERRDIAHFQSGQVLRVGWSGRSELKQLTAIDSHALTIPVQHTLLLYYLNELLLYLLPVQDPYPQVFECYQVTLLQLAETEVEPLLRRFEYHLLVSLGMMPDLVKEADSGQAVDAAQWYRLLPQVGMLRTPADDEAGFPGAFLLALAAGQFEALQWRRYSKRLMRTIIDFNLHGRTLQSRKLYQQMNLNRTSHEQ